jgi:hypothetical protein
MGLSPTHWGAPTSARDPGGLEGWRGVHQWHAAWGSDMIGETCNRNCNREKAKLPLDLGRCPFKSKDGKHRKGNGRD